MGVYLSMIILTFAISCAAVSTKRGNRVSYVWILMILILWVVIYAFRYNTGTDFSGYYYFFNRIGLVNQSYETFMHGKRDFLFYALEYCSYQLFEGSWVKFSIILGILTYLPILLTIRKESTSFALSTLLYIFTLNYFSGFNGVRQAVAVGLIFWGYYKFFKNDRYLLYFIVMVVAYGFHSTVLFAIPFHFLTKKTIQSKVFKIVTAFLLFTYVFLWGLWAYLIDFLDLIGQDKLAEDYANAVANGSSMLRMFVYILPAIIALIFYKKMKAKFHDIDGEIIMVLLSGIFMLFSTKYWIFARIALYFYVPSILLIPKLGCVFSANSKKIASLLIGVVYFMYMYIMLRHGDGQCLPYTFIDISNF